MPLENYSLGLIFLNSEARIMLRQCLSWFTHRRLLLNAFVGVLFSQLGFGLQNSFRTLDEFPVSEPLRGQASAASRVFSIASPAWAMDSIEFFLGQLVGTAYSS
jgi:hypothetical protein